MNKFAVLLRSSFAAACLSPTLAAQTSVYLGPGSCQFNCPPGSTAPCCIGQWSGPFVLGVSCADCTAGFPCGAPHHWDEIAHAALLPWGGFWEDEMNPGSNIPVGGKVLVWTTCDDETRADETEGYRTHVIDATASVPHKLWSPDILDIPNATPPRKPSFGPLDATSGIFCSGHTWILDEQGDPKLMVAGGVEHGTTCGSDTCALEKGYWFDPLAATPNDAWSDYPDDLPERNWYPSLITYRESAVPGNTNDKFSPIAFGGSGIRPSFFGCATEDINGVTGELYQYDHWWTRSIPYSGGSGAWDIAGVGTYFWQQYPRTMLMSNEKILSIGSALICESGLLPAVRPQTSAAAIAQYGAADASFGGNPVHEIDIATMTRSNPIMPSPTGVGGWTYANVVLMHTLKDRSLYQTNLSNYDLDRVIISGGSQDLNDDAIGGSGSTDGMDIVREWDDGQLRIKAPALYDRVYGNLVALPDGSLLSMGGREEALAVSYVDEVSRFWPDAPTSPGVWEAMATRPVFGGTQLVTPRGYHSVALLLQDGSVALMGGRHEQALAYQDVNSRDSIEVYKPPYMFESDRLRITGGIPTMRYGTEVSFSVTDPDRVIYACLIGLSSVTHHFDYGARYVELMTSMSGVPGVKAWIPSDPDLLPEGIYQLYVVEERALNGAIVRVPSALGRFVKVTF